MAGPARSTATERRRWRLLTILTQHGLSPNVAQAVLALGAQLRDETFRTKAERAAVLDVETGAPLGQVVAGTADRLEPGVLLRQMAPGRHYVVLHTHPGSTSLSVLDVALLVAQPAVAMVIAVGTDGTWYIGSLDTQRQRPSLRTIYDGYDATYRATVDQYDALTTAGRLSQRQAGRRHSHEVWVQAGPALGVRYDRVAGVRRT